MALDGFSIGDTPAAGSGGPAAPPSPSTSGSALSGFSIGGVAPYAPPKVPTASLVANTPAPKDTSSLFSKFTGFLSNVGGKISSAISSATTAPDASTLGKNANVNTLRFLPSELARQIPGVAQLQDDTQLQGDIAKYGISGKDVAGVVPGVLADTAKGFATMPIKAGADVYDAARVLTGHTPNASFTVPGLGKVTSDVLDATTAIKNGEDPVTAVLKAGSSSIFNTLFFADIVNRVAAPRAVKVLETQGSLPEGAPQVPGAKTGRLYEQPTAYNRGGAQVLPQEMLDQMKAQGVKLGDNFNPSQPVFFKTTIKGGAYTGEMYQVKPSFLATAYEKVFGTKPPTETLPALLGSEPSIPSKALTSPEIAALIEKAPPEVATTLHSQTVKETDLVKATNDAVAKNPAPVAPTIAVAKPEPNPPSTALTVSHNAIRLLGGDTAHAEKGAALLKSEIKNAVAEHDVPTAVQALTEKLGVDTPTAQRLVAEVQANQKIDPHEVLAQVTGTKVKGPKVNSDVDQKTPAVKNNYHVLYTPGRVGGVIAEPTHIPISGKPVDLEVPGVTHEFFIHRPLVNGKPGENGWVVSERSTGMSLFSGDEPTQKAAIEKARGIIEKAGPEGVEKAVKMQTERYGVSPSKTAKPKTQKEKVAEAVAEEPLSVKEVAKLTGILEPNVRRILGVGAKDGTFQRVSEGVYVLKTAAGNYAYVEMGDAEASLARMAKEGQKFDSVILDPAYFSRALIGGNRGIKQWNFIQAPEFAKVMKSVSSLVKTDDTHVYLMLSGARTAQPDMEKYVKGAVDADFKVVGEGKFTKLTKGGAPVTNVRGVEAASERMILLTKSGVARAGEIDKSLDFRFVRPAIATSYQTEKPAELMKALIEQSTLKGETVLDPFAGSGVTGAEALKSGRNAVLVEKQESTVENVTKPRIEAAAREVEPKEEETAKEGITRLVDTISKEIGEDATSALRSIGISDKNDALAGLSYQHINEYGSHFENDVKTLYNSFANEEGKSLITDVSFGSNPDNPLQGMKISGEYGKGDKEIMGKVKAIIDEIKKESETNRDLTLRSEDAKKDTPLKINEEEVKRPDILVSKSDFKNLVATLPDQQGDFKVVSNPDGELRMELETPNGYMSLRPGALGLVESQLRIGDVVHVSSKDLKEKGTSFRVTNKDNKVEAMGGGKPSAKKVTAEFAPEKYSSKFGDTEAKEFFDKQNTSRGFATLDSLATVVEKASEMKDFLDETSKKIEVSENVADDLYKLETSNKRDLELAIRMLRAIELTPEDAETLYHYDEDKSVKLNERQQAVYDQFIKPLADQSSEIFSRLKNEGLPMSDEDYTPRFVKGKGNVVDRLVASVKEKKANVGQGGPLTKTSPSMKHRTMKVLEDSSGNRTVVSIKNGLVTGFVNKNPVAMGPLARRVTTKVKEFFDPAVRAKLEELAQSLGITHERHATGATKGLGGKRAGVSFQGENLIKTRLSPDSVLAHEIGHQIDHKYGMQAFMNEERFDKEHRTTLTKEMRALADQRFAGKETTESFKKYVRGGSEKMAVMFEAYISNKALFQEVAPHLYDDFRQFLSDHKELAPFLDIKGSVTLDSTMHGGEHIAGRNGSTFISKDGKKYTIKEATTKEIEQHTNLEYHKNVLVNRVLQYLKLRQVERANEFIEDFKNDPGFKDIAVPSGEEAPSNFKPTRLPQFRQYMMEPRLAEQFNRLADRMTAPEGLAVTLGMANRLLRNAIFFNPFIHIPNLAVHALVNRGLLKFVLPSGYVKGTRAFAHAWDAVIHHNDDYLTALEHGAPLLSSEADTRALAKELLEKMATELEGKPELHTKIAKALGYANPVNLIKAIYAFSGKATWIFNDLVTMQAVYEDMDTYGWSLDRAIAETGKHIPNYRIPTRIGDKPLTAVFGEKTGSNLAHTAAQVMQKPNLSMFGAYHYGALRSYGEMMSDLYSGGVGQRENRTFVQNKKGVYQANWRDYFDKQSFKERAQVVDKLAMMALLGLVIYPYVLDKFAKWITGNKNAQFRRAGSLTFPENISKLLSGEKDVGQVIQATVTPAPATKMAVELLGNVDIFRLRHIYGIGGEGFWNYLADQLAPLQQIKNTTSGNKTATEFFASLGGISTPSSTGGEKVVTAMIYGEKPQLQKELKALIAGGDNQGATEKAREFNIRLKAAIKEALIENGKSGSDAQVQFVFQKDAVRIPGTVAMQNYAATNGKSYVEKRLSDGKPVISTGKVIESDSLVNTVLVYAKAISADPSTAFADIFKGQVIRKVENGTVIVYRMSLQDSQAVKAAQGGDNPTMKLDHTLPLQLGGTNEASNLNLVPTAQWASYTPVEDYLGTNLRAGVITKAVAQKLMLDFKNNIITFDDVKKAVANNVQ